MANDYRGATYGISLIGFSGDIAEIHAVLDAAGINYAAEDSTESQVFVDHNQVGQAVQAINALGYETDEDEE
jgi:hypothetical protein